MQRRALGFGACLLAVLVGLVPILIRAASADFKLLSPLAVTSINVNPDKDTYGYHIVTWEWDPAYSCPHRNYGIQTRCPLCNSCRGDKWDPNLNAWITGFPTPPMAKHTLNCNQETDFPVGPTQVALLPRSYNLQNVTWWLSNCGSVWSYSHNPFSVP